MVPRTHNEQEWDNVPESYFHFTKDEEFIHKLPTMTKEAYEAKVKEGWDPCTKNGGTIPAGREKTIAKLLAKNSKIAKERAIAEEKVKAKAADPLVKAQMDALRADVLQGAAAEIEQMKEAALEEIKAAAQPTKAKEK